MFDNQDFYAFWHKIPTKFKKEELPRLIVGEEMTMKMYLKSTMDGWKIANDQIMPIGDC